MFNHNNIETLRIFATLLLVSYHAIGYSPLTGLQVDGAHPLRLFADFFVDVRMPVFAFISGWVFAYRPVSADQIKTFYSGKIRRLIVPGLIAASLMLVMTRFVSTQAFDGDVDLFSTLTLSSFHFWFLQVIFILLVCMGTIEAVIGRVLGPVALLVLIAVILLAPSVSNPYFELLQMQYLAPFFLFGIFCHRNIAMLARQYGVVISVAAVCCIIGLGLNVQEYLASGQFSLERRDLQSALASFGLIVLLLGFLPTVPAFAAFGSVSFTIYLYHVFGTSGGRRIGNLLGIEDTSALFVLSLCFGVLVPLVMHFVLIRFPRLKLMFLGQKMTPQSQKQT